MNEQQKIEHLITQSGNNFHCRVLNFFKEREWVVLISPYYNDNISDKPREIDIIAEKAFRVNDRFGHPYGDINIKLFIECKYIPQEVVFWFHEKDVRKARDLVTRTTPLKKDNIYTEKHHYLKENYGVAKLFASEYKKNIENEPIYKALNQSLNAMVYYRNSASILPLSSWKERNTLATVNYPVIVCNSFDKFYKVDIESPDKHTKIKEYFQLEVNYAYMDTNKSYRNEYFLIDIIDFDKAGIFLEALEEDVNAIKNIIS